MNKEVLEDYLHNLRVPLMISLFFARIPKKMLIENLEKSTLKINDDEVILAELAKSIADGNQFNIIMRNYVNLALKNSITDYYESILKYCDKTEQSHLFQNQEWYRYSRLVRNGLSHSYEWDFSKTKMPFPIKYKHIVINRDLHGTLLTENQMPLSIIWELLKEMENFVKNDLT